MDTKEKLSKFAEVSQFVLYGIILKHISRIMTDAVYQKAFETQDVVQKILVDSIPNAIQAFPYTIAMHEFAGIFIEDRKSRLIAASLIMTTGIILGEAIAVPIKDSAFNWRDVIAESIGAGTALALIAKSNTKT